MSRREQVISRLFLNAMRECVAVMESDMSRGNKPEVLEHLEWMSEQTRALRTILEEH